jgi:acyl-CoA synthetase (NDP forming)
MSEPESHFLLEPEAISILEQYAIPYPAYDVAHNPEEAAKIAAKIGFPVVLKIVSPDAVHKSDVGGVMVGLQDAAGVRQGYTGLIEKVRSKVSQAHIEGILVCKQAPAGAEVIIGGLIDPTFGQTIMFGLGGIFTEVLKDVSFRIAPLERRDAEEMIREIQGYPLLSGVRGQAACDLEALVDLLLSVSRMVMEHPEIRELDLNPVRLYEKGLLVLDARILWKQNS